MMYLLKILCNQILVSMECIHIYILDLSLHQFIFLPDYALLGVFFNTSGVDILGPSYSIQSLSGKTSHQMNRKQDSFNNKMMNQYYCFGTRGLAVDERLLQLAVEQHLPGVLVLCHITSENTEV